jgi:hypothetical protein
VIPLIVTPCPVCGNESDFERLGDEAVRCAWCGDIREIEND